MDNFIQDCFADIDETPLSNIVDGETMIKFKLVGLSKIRSLRQREVGPNISSVNPPALLTV